MKSGALTVLCIGKTSSDHRDFHTEDHIYPEDFRSARIFWSMRTPFSRTLYIFDIMRADPGAGDGPLFKVTAADDRDHPLLSRSAEDLYATIVAAVRECCAAHAPAPRASAAGVYGLNAFQFFGLALPLVRHAIELIPDSVSAMFALPPAVQYKPSFKLPTELDVIRIQQKQMQATVGPMHTLLVIHSFIYLFISLSIHSFIHLSVYPFIYLSIRSFTHSFPLMTRRPAQPDTESREHQRLRARRCRRKPGRPEPRPSRYSHSRQSSGRGTPPYPTLISRSLPRPSST